MVYFWLIPVISLIAFPVTIVFSRVTQQRAWIIPVFAIGIGLIIYCWALLEYVIVGSYYDNCLHDVFTGSISCHYAINWFMAGVPGTDFLDTSLGFVIDPLSLAVAGLGIVVALMVQIYSIGYMKSDPRFGWYYSVQALFISSMLILVLADNFLLLYIAWELVGLCSYLLIGFWYELPSAKEAAKKAFTVTRIGDVGLLIGILLIWYNVGSFNMSALFSAIDSGELNGTLISVIGFLLFLGAMGKSAQFPFHIWLPDAMEGPTPVSALIHAATMVAAGVYLVARTYPLFVSSDFMMLFVAVIGLTTAIGAALICLFSIDLKRALAYSTISHLGLMFLSLGCFGYTAAILHLLAHGFSKALLFLTAGNVMHSIEELDIRKMGNLKSIMPATTILFIIGALSLAGIPLLSGFWSKDEILVSVVNNRGIVFVLLTMLLVFISGLYMIRLVLIPFFGTSRTDYTDAHNLPVVMIWPLIVLALIVFTFGWLAIYMPGIYHSFGMFLYYGHPEQFHLDPVIAVIALIVTLASFTIGYLAYSKKLDIFTTIKTVLARPIKLIEKKYYIDEFFQLCVDKIMMPLSRLVSFLDRVFVNDKGINGPAYAVNMIGSLLRYHITGKIYVYLGLMALGFLAMSITWLLVSY